jgi:hypothetical protein
METESSPTNDSLAARLNSVEQTIGDLAKTMPKRKDAWDKLSSLSGLAVAMVGGIFTLFYNIHTADRDQQTKTAAIKLQELQVVVQFMPYLSGKDENAKRVAVTAINSLANTEIVAKLALGDPNSEGVREGLRSIAATAESPKDRQVAESTLNRICGVEGWSLKTLTDPHSAEIDTRPVPASVDELRSLKRPPEAGELSKPRMNDSRSDLEKKTYFVQARLIGVKLEASSDYDLILADLNDSKKTLTARIPAPECATPSAYRDQFLQARKAVDTFLRAAPSGRLKETDAEVEIAGVGFFNFVHGQRGVAPNGFELHPVLSVRFLATPQLPTSQ